MGSYKVLKFINIRRGEEDFELLVHWEGFEPSSASWQPLANMFEDALVMTENYLHSIRYQNLLAKEALEVIRYLKDWSHTFTNIAMDVQPP